MYDFANVGQSDLLLLLMVLFYWFVVPVADDLMSEHSLFHELERSA
jgi:hypothetical protein